MRLEKHLPGMILASVSLFVMVNLVLSGYDIFFSPTFVIAGLFVSMVCVGIWLEFSFSHVLEG